MIRLTNKKSVSLQLRVAPAQPHGSIKMDELTYSETNSNELLQQSVPARINPDQLRKPKSILCNTTTT